MLPSSAEGGLFDPSFETGALAVPGAFVPGFVPPVPGVDVSVFFALPVFGGAVVAAVPGAVVAPPLAAVPVFVAAVPAEAAVPALVAAVAGFVAVPPLVAPAALGLPGGEPVAVLPVFAVFGLPVVGVVALPPVLAVVAVFGLPGCDGALGLVPVWFVAANTVGASVTTLGFASVSFLLPPHPIIKHKFSSLTNASDA